MCGRGTLATARLAQAGHANSNKSESILGTRDLCTERETPCVCAPACLPACLLDATAEGLTRAPLVPQQTSLCSFHPQPWARANCASDLAQWEEKRRRVLPQPSISLVVSHSEVKRLREGKFDKFDSTYLAYRSTEIPLQHSCDRRKASRRSHRANFLLRLLLLWCDQSPETKNSSRQRQQCPDSIEILPFQ